MATGLKFGIEEEGYFSVFVAKTKALIRCAFVFAYYAKSGFSHDAAQIMRVRSHLGIRDNTHSYL